MSELNTKLPTSYFIDVVKNNKCDINYVQNISIKIALSLAQYFEN